MIDFIRSIGATIPDSGKKKLHRYLYEIASEVIMQNSFTIGFCYCYYIHQQNQKSKLDRNQFNILKACYLSDVNANASCEERFLVQPDVKPNG